MRRLSPARAAALNLLFPPRCAYCDADLPELQDDLLLCADCRLLLGPPIWPGCPKCGALGEMDSGDHQGCRLCRKMPLKFDSVIPLGGYDSRLRGAVLRMKRPSGDSLADVMVRLYIQLRGRQLAELQADLIAPIPMHWLRRLGRGTNSPEILASRLGRFLGVPVVRGLLVRCRNTLPQADLAPSERFANVRGAFRVRAGYDLQGARVLLVDDVLTTGATCSEAARVLKSAGADRVVAAVLARAQGPQAT